MTEQNSAPKVDGSAFGIYGPGDEGTGTPDLFEDDPVTTEAAEVAPVAPPVEPQQPAPAEVASQPEPKSTPSQPSPTPQQPGTEEKLYLGKYKTPEELEDAYKNVQRFEASTRQRAEAAEAKAQQMEAVLRQVAERLQAQEQQQQFDEYGVPQTPDPQQLQTMIAQQAQQQVAAQEQQRLQQEVQSTITAFRGKYQDVTPGSEVDQHIAQIVMEFQTDPDDRTRKHELFPPTMDNLEIAYVLAKNPRLHNMVQELDLVPTEPMLRVAQEAVQNPALAEILLANPALVDTDHGIAWARKQAQLPTMVATAQRQAQGPSPAAVRKAAHVETGGTGAPVTGAPGAKPRDEVDEAVVAYRGGAIGNVFGV